MKLIFLSKRRELKNVYSFVFKPIEATTWLAGQSIRLEIEDEERRFSIVAAPYEQHIAIATRISDSKFKQALMNLAPGQEIDGYNIEGTFVWGTTAPKKLLLASGVGITPYYSMFKQLVHDDEPLDATLIYANRDNHFLFGEELRQLSLEHPELKLVFLPGRRLDKQVIDSYHAEITQSLVYISGPEVMINEITPLLLESGVKKDWLMLDIFTGRPGWES